MYKKKSFLTMWYIHNASSQSYTALVMNEWINKSIHEQAQSIGGMILMEEN
jgi:hypothetical protein